MATPDYLGPIFGLSEIAISYYMRSGKNSTNADRGSLRMLWVVIIASIAMGVYASKTAHAFGFSEHTFINPLGIAIFSLGLALRWYSIFYLGKYFTVNVAIADDHKVIDSGPYKYARHPSYTGALMAFAGYGLCMCNWLAFVLIFVPVCAVFLYRIRIEEKALSDGLGQAYVNYMQKTKRLIPYIY